MPIYEFKCGDCEQEYEALVFSTSEAPPCKKCGSENVQKLMSMFSAKSGDQFAASSSGSDCTGCTSKNCSSCG